MAASSALSVSCWGGGGGRGHCSCWRDADLQKPSLSDIQGLIPRLDERHFFSVSPLLMHPQLLTLRSLYEGTDVLPQEECGKNHQHPPRGLETLELDHDLYEALEKAALLLSACLGPCCFTQLHKPQQVFLSTDYIGSCLRRPLTAFAEVRRRLQARLQGLQHLSHRRSAASPASPPAAAFSRHSRLHTMYTVA